MDFKLEIDFLSGGHTRCESWWTMEAAAIDLCFKLYCVTDGSGQMEFESQSLTLKPGNIYLINGFKLKRQWCDNYMDVFWVHFVPNSISHRLLSSHLPCIHSWSCRKVDCDALQESIDDIYCQNAEGLRQLAADCCIRGITNSLLAQLLRNVSQPDFYHWSAAFAKIKNAIDYMDSNYTLNPALETIAAIANLTPNYFHRAFKQIIGITPHDYMLRKRLNKAKGLLTSTDLPISQIAELSGYENSYYFSRIFKKHSGKTPSQIRQNSPV